jgi:Ni,Fe-hydrogenase III large subunit
MTAAGDGGGGEGMALVEGFRGDVLAWVRLGAGGIVAACHLRDPSWFQWPLLETAIDGMPPHTAGSTELPASPD